MKGTKYLFTKLKNIRLLRKCSIHLNTMDSDRLPNFPCQYKADGFKDIERPFKRSLRSQNPSEHNP